MAQIFVSHSRDDIRLRQWFDEIFAGSPVKAIRFEFEFEAQAENPIPSIYSSNDTGISCPLRTFGN